MVLMCCARGVLADEKSESFWTDFGLGRNEEEAGLLLLNNFIG